MDANDQPQARAVFTKWQRMVLLSLLFVAVCSFNVFGTPIASNDGADNVWHTFLHSAYMGVILAEPVSLAVWMALAGSSPKVRITVGLGLMLLLAATAAIGQLGFGNYLGSANSLLVPLGLQLIVTFLPLLVMRCWTRWRIQRTSADSSPNKLCDQFSIRWLMIWTMQIALFGGLLNYLQSHFRGIQLVNSSAGSAERVVAEFKEPIDEHLWQGLYFCLAALPAIPGAWMILGRHRAMAIGTVVTLLAQAGAAGFVYFSWVRVPDQTSISTDDWAIIGGVISGVGLGSSLIYFVLRAASYRLVRVSNAAVGRAATHAPQVLALPITRHVAEGGY
jgi:hypothetical protein